MKYLKVFETDTLQAEFRSSENYIEPHVSCLTNGNNVKYNIYTSEEKTFLSKPFTIKALDSGDLTWNLENRTLLYSKNGGEWTTMDSSTTISMLAGDEVAFKGENDTYWTCTIVTTMNFDVFGNIMSLTDGDNYKTANTVNENAFRGGLFYNPNHNEHGVVNAKYLMLPAMNLGIRCYFNMFRYCTNLLTAPKLPATVLTNRCYGQLFEECVNLIEPPELPATTLDEACYRRMFYGCTSLKYAPELPATTLAPNCYDFMFYGCTNLVKVPKLLPATTLTTFCYQAMFAECENLKTSPLLPATTLASNCYAHMFNGCSRLELPEKFELPATTLTDSCYLAMFTGTSFTEVQENLLPATTLANSCYYGMFQNNENIVTVPKLPAQTLVENCYRGLFLGCTSLQHIECMATDISATNCLAEWVKNVSPTGTFIKASDDVQWPTGKHGIPEGWTVETASS